MVSYVFELVDFEGLVFYLVISWSLPVKIFIYLLQRHTCTKSTQIVSDIHTHAHTYTHTVTHACTCTCMRMCIYTHIHLRIRKYTFLVTQNSGLKKLIHVFITLCFI